MYLGRSPVHASNVALVLNLNTGHVSPQYHLVFDDEFSTVKYLTSNNIPLPNWADLTKNHASHNQVEQLTTVIDRHGEIEETREDIEIFDSPPTSTDVEEGIQESRESEVPQSEEMRETSEEQNQFIDIETLGLRRSSRIQERDEGRPLQSKSMLFKATKAVGLFAMTLASIHNKSYNQARSHHSRNLIKYHEILDYNFDGS